MNITICGLAEFTCIAINVINLGWRFNDGVVTSQTPGYLNITRILNNELFNSTLYIKGLPENDNTTIACVAIGRNSFLVSDPAVLHVNQGIVSHNFYFE